MLLALLASLALTQPLPALPIEGKPGHIRVEAQTAAGWVELKVPAYRLTQIRQSISFPAELAKKGVLTLRLKALDNDETQIDQVSLAGGSLLSAKDTASGQDLLGKLSKADRDVAEIQGTEVLLSFTAPAGAQELSLELEARSSNNASISREPYRLGARAIKGADCTAKGPMLLEPREGAELLIDSGVMASGSGHPDAPLLGHLRVVGGRLKGRLDFGADNDPGADDYAAIVAYNAKGKAKEFKVTPVDTRFGRAEWVYGDAASWQHMRFDFDVPLAEVPRAKDGSLALELLAYGTCSPIGGPNADWQAGVLSISGAVIPNNLTWTVSVAVGAGGNNSSANITVTTKLYSPFGVTLSTQAANVAYDGAACTYAPTVASFTYNPPCSGTYTIWADAQGAGGGDPNLNNPKLEQTVVVTGGSPCVATTPTPTATPYVAPAPTTAINSPRRGEPMIIAFPKPAKSSKIIFYNLEMARVAELVSGPGSARWETGAVSPGIYLLRITANLEDGSNLDEWKKAVIQP